MKSHRNPDQEKSQKSGSIKSTELRINWFQRLLYSVFSATAPTVYPVFFFKWSEEETNNNYMKLYLDLSPQAS